MSNEKNNLHKEADLKLKRKMKRNLIKEQRNALIKEYAENNPDFQSGRKIVYNLLTILIMSRILHFILVITHIIINGNYLGTFGVFLQIFQVLIACCFAIIIYSIGVKGLVYLALIGGIYSLYSAFQKNAFYGFGNDDILFNINVVIFIISMTMQIFSMTFFIFNNKCKVFFNVMPSIVKEWQKIVKAEL